MDIPAETWLIIGRCLGAGFALGLGGLGAALGMGIAAGQANEGIMRQPGQHGYMLRAMLIGQAVGGSPSIFALVVGLLIAFLGVRAPETIGGNVVCAYIAAGIAIGLGCFGSGWGCGYPAGAACDGVARNPRRSSQVVSGMVIGQAVAQSPSIFATVIALIMLFSPQVGTDWAVMGILLGSGLAVGAGALGPGFGSGQAAGGAVKGLSRWPRAHGLVVRTMLVGQAVCQTPAIFGLLVAFIMMYGLRDAENTLVWWARTLAAGISVGVGGIGPGLGSGIAASKGCEASALNPLKEAVVLRTMLTGQAVSQSTAIYALIIALVILFVV
ncbi:MAG: ATP synthase F0 subunit C [Candidatus Hydrogenedentota bacterium]